MKDVKIFHDEGSIELSIIEEYEKNSIYRFPMEYKVLISKHNALNLVCDTFEFIDPNGNKNGSGIVFLGYETERNYNDILHLDSRSEDNPIPNHMVVFGEDAGGNMIAFDYRENKNTNNPKVTFIYHDWTDDNTEEFSSGYYQTAFIADSFEEFMDNLYCTEDD